MILHHYFHIIMPIDFANAYFNLYKIRVLLQHFNDFSLFQKNVDFVNLILLKLIIFLGQFPHISVSIHRLYYLIPCILL